jgi:response regulator RpfG family c-di-GMP phosphodiesterase
MNNRKILFVDDDVNILEGLNRQFRKQFEIRTAAGGEQGLVVNGIEGPFAVVVSDYRMPQMNGIEFLKNIQKRSPDTVRIMLSGNADMQTAIDAVNEGHIFRFLTKPCEIESLLKTLEAAVEQFRLITAERELLKNTLTGSIHVLVEILSMVNPMAFARASRIRKYVQHTASRMRLSNLWQYEVAALLSQIGCMTLPLDLLNKYYSGGKLNAEETVMYATHPNVGYELLSKIPRLETIARMIKRQQLPFREAVQPEKDLSGGNDEAVLGSQILKVALDFDQLVYGGLLKEQALIEMRNRRQDYNPQVLEAMESIVVDYSHQNVKTVKVKDLQFGMVAEEDIRDLNGLLLVAKGQEITYPVIVRLQNIAARVGVKEPFRISVPSLQTNQ